MASLLFLSGAPSTEGVSIPVLPKLSSFRSAIPTSVLFSRKSHSGTLPKIASFQVKSQYVTPQEQNYHQQRFSSHDSSFSSQPGKLPPKVYVGYTIYKGKAAFAIEPRPPEFSPLDSGAVKLSKEGFIMLQFAPAAGLRQYDWSRKQLFSLSVAEVGTIISLGARDSCEFFHDPFKGRSEEGKVRKVLKVEPLPDGSGHFFNISVQNRLTNSDESIYIPITKGEFAVLVSSMNFIIPYLLGWHTFANSLKPEDASRTNPRNVADFEWNR